MDLRLIIHRGLVITISTILSLLPVALLLAIFWRHLSDLLEPSELVLVLIALCGVTLLVPPTRDLARRFLDRYVYRTHANYQRTVREASRALTRVLDLKSLLPFLSHTIATSTECEGVAIYVQRDGRFRREIIEKRHSQSDFDAPHELPDRVARELTRTKEPLVTDERTRESIAEAAGLHAELTRLNWALVLPLVFEHELIGAIVAGPKLSGDPFYPQDLDLLTTLANQAGIAIKNARLYAEVVLANEYIENIVATIESGVIAIDASGQITMFNRAAEQLTNIAADRARAKDVTVLPGSIGDALKSTVTDGQARTLPEIPVTAGTATRPVICTTSALRDDAGAVLGAVAVFSDLTPLKELEVERRRAERLAYFEMLASGIAHEIKNPLVAIKTFSQLIPRRHSDPRFVEDFSRIVTREIGRMERLVERLRTLSRPSDRPQVPLDLRAPITEALEFLQPSLEEKRIAVTVSLGEAPVSITGDHGDIEELFLNLLMNALEATPPDGAISVRLTSSPQHITVTIGDTGPGIAPDALERVFDPFFTTKRHGAGLGLAIAAGIADAHQARLRATNSPGGGALFTIDFPLATIVPAAVRP